MFTNLGRRVVISVMTAVLIILTGSSVTLLSAGRSSVTKVTYLILAKQGNFAQMKTRVISSGGQITYEMPELDALIATSSNAQFSSQVTVDSSVEGVAEDQEAAVLSETLSPFEGTSEGTTSSKPTPKDSFYPEQWDIQRIGGTLEQAWAVTIGNRHVKIAILDTGIYAKHPDIAPNLDASLSRSFITNTPPQDPDDLSERDLAGHGTFVAGQIAGAFGGGKIVGVGPGLSVVNVKMINKHGRLWFSWALPAIYYAAMNRFDVINMSWSGVIDTSTATGNLWWKAFQRVAHFADSRGSLLMAAAGNNSQRITGTNLRRLPAELPEAMAVSATTFEDQLSSYSNYGSTIALSAPAGDIPPANEYYPYLVVGAFSPDAMSGKFYAWATGTSFAVPKVAGTAGLILSLEKLPVSQLKAKLQQTSEDLGKPGRDEQFGFGLVDADRAVR